MSSDTRIHYRSRSRVESIITLIITLVVLLLIVLPIYVLSRISYASATNTADGLSIVILLMSTFLFMILLSCFTEAKRHELLVASAGYGYHKIFHR